MYSSQVNNSRELPNSINRTMIRFLYFILVTTLPVITALAQDETGKEENTTSEELGYSLNSPNQTVFTHLNYLQEDSYQPRIAGKVFYEGHLKGRDPEQLAIRLKQVFDAKGYYIDLEEVPGNPNYFDSLTQRSAYALIPNESRVTLRKIDGSWYYSKKTVDAVDELFKETFPFGTHRLVELAPGMGSGKILGLYVWQHLALLIIILVAFIIQRLLTFLFEGIIRRLLLRIGYGSVADEVILPIARPISYIVMVFFLIVSAPLLQLPVTLSRWVNIGLNAAWPVFITVFAYRLVDIVSLYLQKIADRTANTLDDMLVPLVRKALKAFVVAAGILFILKNLGQDITALIAGLSIGGLALALAAQDTIKNFFGSLMIFVDKPFQVGDWITSGDIDGTVEEVGFRSTRVRTFRNSLVYVPNGVIADRMIDNHGERQYRRFYTKLAVTYDSPPDLVELFVEGLRELVKNHPKTRKDYYEIHLNDFNNSSIDVMFYIFFNVPSWSEELAARHEIMLSIIRLAETLGINFAFPTQTLHVENFPGKPSLSSQYKSAAELKPAMESFLKDQR